MLNPCLQKIAKISVSLEQLDLRYSLIKINIGMYTCIVNTIIISKIHCYTILQKQETLQDYTCTHLQHNIYLR